MDKQDPNEILKKYLPSKRQLFKQCGYAFLASLIVGLVYGGLLMDVNGSLTASDEMLFRIGMGLYISLGMTFLLTTPLVVVHLVKIAKAKKQATDEVVKQYTNKK
ncbi:hypothetical protein DUG83_13555 [Vibrio parahaemolyticus]|uniref:hypothetical protein n=1 Tax=Vibrio parahaemolyticus TaxID=670 RepID=UPI00047090D0|nr:hypothetical protein [Vibrio parahaemolyticus]ELB2756039.1 hypothetical protein [Vibrio alginolyticus]EGQ7817292.1 hypothetical protein [Vibrio parahaemolyticus]EGQ8701901.1 hypothetical protein [Vibrio parahaemolyticus]EGQ9123338.1 hypothetical protein [Vibrio parahaemolyticus]EGQ9479060.1 hypothetical protein [Vibrio parahaemolyticus]